MNYAPTAQAIIEGEQFANAALIQVSPVSLVKTAFFNHWRQCCRIPAMT